jgi:two-component system sensor histidine kinase TctE
MPQGWGDAEGGARRAGAAHSLFGEILDWMFAPLLLLWPMSVSLTYLVAQTIAASPYDRALLARAKVLAEHVQFEGARTRIDLPASTLEPLLVGDTGGAPGAFLVVDSGGAALAGDGALPRPAEAERPASGEFVLRTDTLRGREVRVAYAWIAPPKPPAHPSASAFAPASASAFSSALSSAPGAALVEVAEPMDGRTQLANEIIKGVILPQFVVLPLALLLVWFGLTRGLAPLARLQETIQRRRPDDLAPIPPAAAPEEIAPLVASFNELLARTRRSLELQQRFIADAAHQMKTPLAGLRTQAELAQREGNAQELQSSLRQIATSTERATRLINQLLALARAEHGAGEPAAKGPLDLDGFARAVVREWVPQALAQRIDLGYEGAAGPQAILGEPLLLREMLNNLIDNAMRYSTVEAEPATGGTGSASAGTVTVRVRGEAVAVVLEIEDSGPGIPPEERERIFERFFRVLGNPRDGSGLGLAIVREIASQHFAVVEVGAVREGAARPGAIFRVRFRPAIGEIS